MDPSETQRDLLVVVIIVVSVTEEVCSVFPTVVLIGWTVVETTVGAITDGLFRVQYEL